MPNHPAKPKNSAGRLSPGKNRWKWLQQEPYWNGCTTSKHGQYFRLGKVVCNLTNFVMDALGLRCLALYRFWAESWEITANTTCHLFSMMLYIECVSVNDARFPQAWKTKRKPEIELIPISQTKKGRWAYCVYFVKFLPDSIVLL